MSETTKKIDTNVIEALREQLITIKNETAPIPEHADPKALIDCWDNVWEYLDRLGTWVCQRCKCIANKEGGCGNHDCDWAPRCCEICGHEDGCPYDEKKCLLCEEKAVLKAKQGLFCSAEHLFQERKRIRASMTKEDRKALRRSMKNNGCKIEGDGPYTYCATHKRNGRNCNVYGDLLIQEVPNQFKTEDGRSPCPGCWKIRGYPEKDYYKCRNCGYMFIPLFEEVEH